MDLLLKLVENVTTTGLVFCDSSAFRRDNTTFLRRLMAASPLVIAPQAVPELERVRERALAEPDFRELAALIFPDGQTLSARISVVDLEPLRPVLPSLSLYVALLEARKRLLASRLLAFEREHGRPPNKEEHAAIVAQLRTFGARAAALARKDHSPGIADEALVVISVFVALLTKRDVLVIADDNDVLEQFYKFTSLLRRDYEAHRLATDLRDTPNRYGARLPIPETAPVASLTERHDSSFAVQLPNDISFLIPSGYTTRAIQVVRPRDGGESILWCGIEQMESLLRVQSETGCNSDVFLPLNVYVDLPSLPGGASANAFIVRDVTHPSNGLLTRVHHLRALVDAETHDPRFVGSNMYQAAKDSMTAGRHHQAASAFRKLERFSAKQRLPANQTALAEFAQAVALEQVTPEKAIELYDRIIKHHSNTRDRQLLVRVLSCRINKSRALGTLGRHGEALAELDAVVARVAGEEAPELRRFELMAEFNRAQAGVSKGTEVAKGALEAFEARFASSTDSFALALRQITFSYSLRCACESRPADEAAVRNIVAGMSGVMARLVRTRDKWIALNYMEIGAQLLASHRHPRCAAHAYGAVTAELSRLPDDVPFSTICDRMAGFGRRVWPSLRRSLPTPEDWAGAIKAPQDVFLPRFHLLLAVGLEGVRPREELVRIYGGVKTLRGDGGDAVVEEAQRRKRMHENGDEEGLRREPVFSSQEPTVFSEIPLSISKAVIAAGIKAAAEAGDVRRAAELAAIFKHRVT